MQQSSMSGASVAEQLRMDSRRLRELPPLPREAERILALLGDDDVSIADLADAIDCSPPLAARVVGLARSAYFGRMPGVNTVSDAIIKVLGLSLVKSLATGIALGRAFDASRCPAFQPDRYWSSALLTASMARLLARRASVAGVPDGDSAYLCGLLHNLGMLAMGHLAPDALGAVLRLTAEDPNRRSIDVARELFATDHAEVGAWVAEQWQLPAQVRVSIANHHQPGYRGSDWQCALLVGVSARWARQRLSGVETPLLEPAGTRQLGIDDGVLERVVAECNRRAEEVDALTRLMMSGP